MQALSAKYMTFWLAMVSLDAAVPLELPRLVEKRIQAMVP